MMRTPWLILTLLLAGCGPIPITIAKTSQEQTQRVSNELSQDQRQEQQSSHASESKQGTNSMPVVVVCVQNNSSRSSCAVPAKPMADSIKELQK